MYNCICLQGIIWALEVPLLYEDEKSCFWKAEGASQAAGKRRTFSSVDPYTHHGCWLYGRTGILFILTCGQVRLWLPHRFSWGKDTHQSKLRGRASDVKLP